MFLDLKDPVPTDAEQCELTDRRKVDEEPGTQILTQSARLRDGHIGVRLHCPRRARCAGKLNGVRYRVAAAREQDGARAGRAARGAVVTARESGAQGRRDRDRRVRVR